MNMYTRIGLAVATMSMPLMAFAAPQSVSNITATLQSDRVHITWKQVNDTDITAYRIFYSHQSILGNNGLYDDFESADGTVNSFDLLTIPNTNDLYISVLAVNAKGEESPYFLQEAHLVLNRGTSSVAMSSAATSVAAASSKAPTTVSNEFNLLTVNTVSSTGVLLTFSHPVVIPAEQALSAFTIDSSNSIPLAIHRLKIESMGVMIETAVQKPGMAYRITINASAVKGIGLNGQLISLPANQAPTLFTGFGTAMESSSAASAPEGEVQQLRQKAQENGNGTYTVETTWIKPAGDIASYIIAQTTDGGITYGTPRTVGPETNNVRVSGIPSGQFGVLVRIMYADGRQSRGIMQSIKLPKSGSPLPGSVTPVPKPVVPPSTNLPNSGPGLWIAIMVTGAFAGAWQAKKREQTA